MNRLSKTLSEEKVLTVSEFTEQIKLLLEGAVSPSWVSGEISNLRHQSSGHIYFSLKDAGSQIACVVFRGDAVSLPFTLVEGLELKVYGQLSLYAPRGSYQLVVRLALKKGIGALQAAFEALKAKLNAEGLFDADKKRPLPAFPQRIGIITSPTGAAIRDFLSVLSRLKFPGTILVLPAIVQGKEAPESIKEQIERAQSQNLDLLVLARGGGNLEDLWGFNDETLVRKIAQSSVPTLSAVGHEIDFTLSDFVADKRAETPSAAAEMIARQFLDLKERHLRAQERFRDYARKQVQSYLTRLRQSEQLLRRCAPERVLEHQGLKLDDLSNRLDQAFQRLILGQRERLTALEPLFSTDSIQAKIEKESLQLKIIEASLTTFLDRELQRVENRLSAIQDQLEAYSVKRTLKRGFMIMKRLDGPILTRRSEVPAGELLIGEFADGTLGFYTLEGPKKI